MSRVSLRPAGLTYRVELHGGAEALRQWLRWKGGRLRHPGSDDMVVKINGEDMRKRTVRQACKRAAVRSESWKRLPFKALCGTQFSGS